MASKICKRVELMKINLKNYMNIDNYCGISTAHLILPTLFLFLRICYLYSLGRLVPEIGVLSVWAGTLFAYWSDRCTHCDACFICSEICLSVQKITLGWREGLPIFDNDISPVLVLLYSDPRYWEFFWKSTFIPILPEIYLIVTIMFITMVVAIIDFIHNGNKILTSFVGKILVVFFFYYLSLLLYNICIIY